VATVYQHNDQIDLADYWWISPVHNSWADNAGSLCALGANRSDRGFGEEGSLKTISDAAALANNWQAGFGQDFMSRADGYAGFSKAYGFNFAKQPREMDLSLTYRALQSGELDIIAGNSTDGLIAALDLFQLEDDKHYFPPYQAVFIARAEVSETLNETFNTLKNAISTDTMRRLNYEVDGNKRTPKDVAAAWIAEKRL